MMRPPGNAVAAPGFPRATAAPIGALPFPPRWRA